MYTIEQYQEAADSIQSKLAGKNTPEIGLVLGSGLSSLADGIPNAIFIDYGDIPHWPRSTVEGHSGRLVIGELEGKSVLIMQGRVHMYEGYSAQDVTFPVRVMKLLGIETVILTNAAGGLNPAFHTGDLMLITDHINWVGMAGKNPLVGPNLTEFGTRFPDMTFTYNRDLQALARKAAKQAGVDLREGVYTWLAGPNYETPAEIRMLYRLGSDAVGMSTVPSAIVANHCGMRVLGISTITNVAPHHPEPTHETTHEEVMEVGKIVVPKLTALVKTVLQAL